MRILIYGAGVIGSNLAADLFSSGKDVTILARGEWADTVEKNGLVVKNAFLPGKKTFKIPVIRELKADDKYDVIFVVFRCTQVEKIFDTLNRNNSTNIVIVGNNLSTNEHVERLPDKNVMFAFYMAAGHRDKNMVVSFSMKKITIGQRSDGHSNEKLIQSIFDNTKIKTVYQPDMEDYLLCHAAFVTPIAFACYHCDGDLRKIKKDESFLNQIIDANIEGYNAIENAGHKILPESDQDFRGRKYRKLCYRMYKVMCFTKIGKICASDHALNAVEEMFAMSDGIKRFFAQNNSYCPTYYKLEKDALEHIKR